MCLLVMVYGPCQGMHQVAAPPTALSRGSFMLLIQISTSHSINPITQSSAFPNGTH